MIAAYNPEDFVSSHIRPGAISCIRDMVSPLWEVHPGDDFDHMNMHQVNLFDQVAMIIAFHKSYVYILASNGRAGWMHYSYIEQR